MISKPQNISVRIERLVPGGEGLGRAADGRVVLVRGGLPGDVVAAQVTAQKAGLIRAQRTLLETPGPDRRPPVCNVNEACGGCPLMPLSPSAQQAAKQDIVAQALARTGRLNEQELAKVLPLLPVGPSLAYRNRIRLQLKDGRLGFFAEGSHDFIEPDVCHVASAELGALLLEVRAGLSRHRPLVADVESIELRVLPQPGDVPRENRASLCFRFRKGAFVDAASAERFRTAFGSLGLVSCLPEEAKTEPRLRAWIDDQIFTYLAPSGFNQVNDEMNRFLVKEVVSICSQHGVDDFIDLYGGAGNFTLPLLARGLRGVLVEWSAEAVSAASAAAREQSLSGGTFVQGDVPLRAQALVAKGAQADAVIVDPPRAGAKDAIGAIAQLARKVIVMVSCDPVTLARDLRELLDRGAVLECIQPLDMFPQTHHVECLAVLRPPLAVR